MCGDFPEMTVINTHGGYPWVTEILFVAFKRPNLCLCLAWFVYNMPRRERYVILRQYLPLRAFLFGTTQYRSSASREGVEQFRLCPSA